VLNNFNVSVPRLAESDSTLYLARGERLPADQEISNAMSELQERTSTPQTPSPLTQRDADKSKLRLMSHGDNRWDDDEYSP
jgi:hypothetical protein